WCGQSHDSDAVGRLAVQLEQHMGDLHQRVEPCRDVELYGVRSARERLRRVEQLRRHGRAHDVWCGPYGSVAHADWWPDGQEDLCNVWRHPGQLQLRRGRHVEDCGRLGFRHGCEWLA